jgi:ankyrin repeat protein
LSIRLLLERGADANVHVLVTPLHVVAMDDQPALLEHLDMASFLLLHGAYITAETKTDTHFPWLQQVVMARLLNYFSRMAMLL